MFPIKLISVYAILFQFLLQLKLHNQFCTQKFSSQLYKLKLVSIQRVIFCSSESAARSARRKKIVARTGTSVNNNDLVIPISFLAFHFLAELFGENESLSLSRLLSPT